jgi:hypothetical protein
MERTDIHISIIIVTILTLLFFIGICGFGIYLFQKRKYRYENFTDYLIDMFHSPNRQDFIRIFGSISNYFGEVLDKRNDFWTTYGQIVICIFFVSILAILLLTGTISAEAGLPILSAIASFAIAKGSTTRTKGNDNPPEKQ